MSADGLSRILAARLRNQHLARPGRVSVTNLVAWFGAMQAQEFGPARWGLGLRARGLRDAAIVRAFDAGAIVRTHAMRPTWHFVAPADLRWLQALTGPRVRAASASVLRANGLDARLLTRTRRTIARALEGGRHLTRQELRAALARAGIDASSQRLAYIVMDAELEALICSGPVRGRRFTYALVDERVPPAAARDRDEALGELATRYFQSHGPATVRDFVWWSGLTVAEARRAIDIARLTGWHEDGADYWHTAARPGRIATAALSAHLLPIYDEYLNAYRDRDLLFTRTSPGPDALFLHYLIVGGRYAGTWKPGRAPGEVDIRPAARLSRAETAAVDEARARHAAFHAG